MKYTPSDKLSTLIDKKLQDAGEYGQDLFQKAFKDCSQSRIVVMYTECREDQSDVHDRMDELVDNVVTLVVEATREDLNIFVGTLNSDIGALGGCTCNVYVAAKTEKQAVKLMEERIEKCSEKLELQNDDGFDDSEADDD